MAAPPAWQVQIDYTHIQDENVQAPFSGKLQEQASTWNGILNTIKITEQRIDPDSGSRLIRSMPYRQVPVTREYVTTGIENKPAADATEPSTTQWVSLVVVASEKDGTLGLCVAYRRVTRNTLSDNNSLSRKENCTHLLRDAVAPSRLDCSSGY